MSPADQVRLRHLLEAAEKGTPLFTRGCIRGDLDTDEKLSLAVVPLLEICGKRQRRFHKQFATPIHKCLGR